MSVSDGYSFFSGSTNKRSANVCFCLFDLTLQMFITRNVKPNNSLEASSAGRTQKQGPT